MRPILALTALALASPALADGHKPGDGPAGGFGAPTYGEVSLVTNFQPDPHTVQVEAGGPTVQTHTDQRTGNRCQGHFADAPDFRLNFTDGDLGFPLSFYVHSGADTVLLVASPDGEVHCNDDYEGLNPAIRFDTPQGGAYNIWVGTYAPLSGQPPVAELSITEYETITPDFTRAFFGEDDRVVIDAATAPWNMIGFLDLSEASCTATLIGPSTVLTSAHCLAENGQIVTPPVEFLAGFQNGAHVARSGISGYHVAQGYLNGEQEGTDYAFVYLTEPLGDQLGWMDVGPLTAQELSALQSGTGPDILQAGYSYDQQGVLTGNLSCPFIEVAPQNVLVHQCDTLQGDSGSPLFIQDGERFRIIGVESRTDPMPDQEYDRNVAMYVDYVVRELATLGTGGPSSGPVTPLK
ncbi:serine protease [Hasllibacter sp. MH4015]|uniref:trypsin-like serine peptidase n=1 Tax=Hasllibacter sp. MH4015 TaxID=2854029 RepID=UPI001CD6E84C|nr:trypsin-like serine protease [Hasllibacter sp. MH4015]